MCAKVRPYYQYDLGGRGLGGAGQTSYGAAMNMMGGLDLFVF